MALAWPTASATITCTARYSRVAGWSGCRSARRSTQGERVFANAVEQTVVPEEKLGVGAGQVVVFGHKFLSNG
jgi:hypothetical protein